MSPLIVSQYSQCWKGFKYAEDAAKPQQAVELLRTNKGLMNNYHKAQNNSCGSLTVLYK